MTFPPHTAHPDIHAVHRRKIKPCNYINIIKVLEYTEVIVFILTGEPFIKFRRKRFSEFLRFSFTNIPCRSFRQSLLGNIRRTTIALGHLLWDWLPFDQAVRRETPKEINLQHRKCDAKNGWESVETLSSTWSTTLLNTGCCPHNRPETTTGTEK